MVNDRLQPRSNWSSAGRLAILSSVLFLSGIGSLIFETLWLRLSGLTFGNSVWSAALILSSFMAGMALGNAFAASSRVQRWRPLKLYAFLELVIAFLGCTIVFGLPLIGEWLRPVFQTLWNYQSILLGLRFVFSFLLLLLPATAMGLTLPVLMEDSFLQRTEFGRAIGILYGVNTLGAVTGALLGEAYLVEAFGLLGTALIAGAATSFAAATALLVARRDGAAPPTAKPPLPLRLSITYRPPWRLLFVSFVTGGILVGLEVVWFRFLRLYVASSSTAFSIMLAVVLAGIGLGGLVSGAIHSRLARSNLLLPVLLLSAAILTLLSYEFFPAEIAQTSPNLFDIRTWPQIALLSFALMFPAAFMSGIIFPLIVARVQTSVGDRMNSTGLTTLFNTSGAALGPLLASFVLLPAVGFQWSLLLSAATYTLLAIFVSERGNWSFKRLLGIATFALLAAFILIIALFPYRRDQVHFAHATLPYITDGRGNLIAEVVKKVEGTADTLQLVRRDLFGQPYYCRLLTNGFSMSATLPRSQRYMRLFAYLPLALRPESEDVLLICYGCGVTADAFTHESRLKRIDIVDISKEVFDLAPFYSGPYSANPLRDPRVTPFVQDGRFFLQGSPRQYDIITGEPPPPKVVGSVNLYTEEFFSLVNDRLKEGGIATFWLPVDQLKVNEAKAILRAFHNAFPNTSVWAGADEEWIMMGIKGPGRKVQEGEIRRLWSDSGTGDDLRRIGLEAPEQLGAMFLMDAKEIDRITDGIAPLTDFYPKRLSDAPWDEPASHRFASTYMSASPAIQRFRGSPIIDKIWPQTLNKPLQSYFIVREARYLSRVKGSNGLAELDLYLRHSRLRVPVLEVLGSDEFRLSIAETVAHNSEIPPPETMPDLVAGALARRDFNDAIRRLEKEKELGALELNDLFILTYLYCLAGEVEKAENLVARNIGIIKRDWFVDWLWGKLGAEFGFHPPP
jgi:spermidine synthase